MRAELEGEVVRATGIFRVWKMHSERREAFCSKKSQELKAHPRVRALWEVAQHGGGGVVRRT